MNADCVIVDANIAFKCLHAGRGDLRSRIGPGQHPQLFSPRFLFVELFKHKERLASAAKRPEPELLEALYALVSRLEFVNEANIPVGTCLALSKSTFPEWLLGALRGADVSGSFPSALLPRFAEAASG